MRNRFLVLALLVVPVGLVAQGYIAYPADHLHGMRGQIIPLGASGSSGSFDEARTQFLIPARFLPPVPDRILALEVSPHVTGTVFYGSLNIYLGHTTAGTLTTVFATNLPRPVLVFSRSNFTSLYPSRRQWQSLPFTTPFLYDGQSSLILEIRKVIDRTRQSQTVSHQTSFYPDRADLPLPLYAYGTLGSGQVNAKTGSFFSASSRLLFRLRFQNAGVQSITSTRSGGRDLFHLGSTVTLTVHGNPGEVFFTALDFGLRFPPLVIPGINGRYWLPAFNVIMIGRIPASGQGQVVLVVPNVPNIVGTHFYFQSARLGKTFDFTNVVDGILAK